MDDDRDRARERFGFLFLIALLVAIIVLGSVYYFRHKPHSEATTVAPVSHVTPNVPNVTTTPTGAKTGKPATWGESAVTCYAWIYDDLVLAMAGTVQPAPFAVEGSELSAFLVCRDVPPGAKAHVRTTTPKGEIFEVDMDFDRPSTGLAVVRGHLGTVETGRYDLVFSVGGQRVANVWVDVTPSP
jgi:hypothetical protein